MTTIQSLLAAAMFIFAGTVSAPVHIAPQESGVDVRLRGISAVSTEVAWASGRQGTVLRTLDGGKHWQVIKVPGAGELDFRDVEGFDADNAVVLSIGPGEASRVYRTGDGGGTWILALQNKDPRAFFDCMVFDGQRGWMLGDPVDGHFQIRATDNGGRDWRLLDDGPKAQEGEAAFAASGSCIEAIGNELLVATGGTTARLHVMNMPSGHWVETNASTFSQGQSRGYFSIASSNGRAFLVGGDYKAENEAGISAMTGRGVLHYFDEKVIDGAEARVGNEIRTPVRRLSIKAVGLVGLQEGLPPRGYRSGVACAHDGLPCIAVGPGGVDSWDGKAWQPVADGGYDAIDFTGNVGWASGDAGRIARIEIAAD